MGVIIVWTIEALAKLDEVGTLSTGVWARAYGFRKPERGI